MEKSKELIFEEIRNNPIFSKFCKDIKPFPKPFCRNLADVKAIVLGADPSNPENKKLEYVFGLENESSPYFTPILKNLELLDLSLKNIYVQNLCPNYFEDVTDENDVYIEVATKYWLPLLKNELDTRFKPEIPVLITAWKPLKVIAPVSSVYRTRKSEIYTKVKFFNENHLGRTVIALFRGGRRKGKNGYYDLTVPEFSEYAAAVKNLIQRT